MLDQATPIVTYNGCQDLIKAIRTTHKVREPNLMSDLNMLRSKERAGYIEVNWIPRE